MMDMSGLPIDVLVGASVGYGVVKNRVDAVNTTLTRLEDTVDELAKTVGDLRVEVARLQERP